jgi:hypothetical protein
VYGIQPRGIAELRDLKQHEFKSTGAEDFATEMRRLYDRVREKLQDINQNDAGASPSKKKRPREEE